MGDERAARVRHSSAHPNRVPFEGVLTLVGKTSETSPSGARGHRVNLTRKAAESALPSLLGMGVNYKSGWNGHDVRQKVGVIEAAQIVGCELRVSGYLFGKDFPEVIRTVLDASGEGKDLGMSFELANAHVADMRAKVWRLTRTTFTGAAILLRAEAAYKKTSFRIVEEAGGLAIAATGDGISMRSIVPQEVECEEAAGHATS